MSTPPVSLQDVKDFLKITSASDDALLTSVIQAATDTIVERCGPMVAEEFTEPVRLDNRDNYFTTVHWPLLSVDTVSGEPADVDEDLSEFDIGFVQLNKCTGLALHSYRQRGRWPGVRLPVGYTAGRDPVPEDMITAVKIVSGHLWDTQRGRSGSRGNVIGLDDDAPIGGDASYLVLQGFAMPRRAMELLRPYWQVSLP